MLGCSVSLAYLPVHPSHKPFKTLIICQFPLLLIITIEKHPEVVSLRNSLCTPHGPLIDDDLNPVLLSVVAFGGPLYETCFEKFGKIYRELLAPKSLFN